LNFIYLFGFQEKSSIFPSVFQEISPKNPNKHDHLSHKVSVNSSNSDAHMLRAVAAQLSADEKQPIPHDYIAAAAQLSADEKQPTSHDSSGSCVILCQRETADTSQLH
jgi:hypothetical protein